MSANPVARPQSRRAFIGALAVLPAGTAVSVATAESFDPAEADLVRWLTLCGKYNTRTDLPLCLKDDAHWAAIKVADDALVHGAPSSMRAAAIVLHELAFITEALSLPGGDTPVDGDQACRAQDARTAVKLLRSLRPQLTGAVARLAADLIDNPSRAFGDSLIARTYAGEV